jgi:hypothetical protein
MRGHITSISVHREVVRRTSSTTGHGVFALPPPELAVVMPPSTQETGLDRMDIAAAPAAASQYKGVVPQPNGRWGAQIYGRHARVWLGTFPDEATAACVLPCFCIRREVVGISDSGLSSKRSEQWI